MYIRCRRSFCAYYESYLDHDFIDVTAKWEIFAGIVLGEKHQSPGFYSWQFTINC